MGSVKKLLNKATSALGLDGGKTPKVVERNPEAEAAAAANQAAETANLEAAQSQ